MIKLSKKPKNAIIIEGFPGMGLVGTIATGFLIDHLRCEKIGKVYFQEAAPTLAIHGCKVIDPVSVYYNKKYNIIIIHSITAPTKIEWQAAQTVLDVCNQIKAKELITLEGVGSETNEPKCFVYSDSQKTMKQFSAIGVECIGEGIIIGVTAALMQIKGNTPVTSIFAETVTKLPDSKAAAKMIETLDKYLGLEVDYKPLLKQAEAFEGKLRVLMEHAERAKDAQQRKQLNYLG